MSNKKSLQDVLSNIRKVRAGEVSSTQLYQVKDDSVLVSVDDDTYARIKSSRSSGRFIEGTETDHSLSDYDDDGEEFWDTDEADTMARSIRSSQSRSSKRNLPHSVPSSKASGPRLDDLFARLPVKATSGGFSNREVAAFEDLDAELNDDAEDDRRSVPQSHPVLGAASSSSDTPSVSLPLCEPSEAPSLLSFGAVFGTAGYRQRVVPDPSSSGAEPDRKRDHQDAVRSVASDPSTLKKPRMETPPEEPHSSEGSAAIGSAQRSPCPPSVATSEAVSSPTQVSDAVPGDPAGTAAVHEHRVAPLLHHCGDDSLLFYLLDVHEEGSRLMLYGKVMEPDGETSQSCCIVLGDMNRNIFIRPRETPPPCQGAPTDDPDWLRIAGEVSDELSELRRRLGIKKWMYRPVQRGFALDIPGIPKSESSLFVKCVYSCQFPPVPASTAGKTFSHIFGADTSLTELFLVKRKVMGPTWLVVTNARPVPSGGSRISHCRHEYVVKGLENIRKLDRDQENPPPPPLTALAMSCQLTFTEVDAHLKRNEVFIIAAAWTPIRDIEATGDYTETADHESFVGICCPSHMPMWPRDYEIQLRSHASVALFDTESALLNGFMDLIHRVDPDILVGHGFIGSALNVIGSRLRDLHSPAWHKMSRLRRSTTALHQRLNAADACRSRTATWDPRISRFLTVGRILCDTELQSRDLLRSRATFDLPSLMSALLPTKPCPTLLPPGSVKQCLGSPSQLKAAAVNCELVALRSFQLMAKLQILPLTRELAILAGHLWSRSLLNLRAERNEYLLLHRFHQHKLIKPERPANVRKHYLDTGLQDDVEDDNEQGAQPSGSRKKKGGYAGGLVLEPRAGLYDRFVLLLDFNSLYPSIIQEYNICFTTTAAATDDSSEAQVVSTKPGLLPSVLRGLVERRRQVKAAMKRADPKARASMEIRQLALKLTANSIYGCLGFSQSRFYARPVAALITLKGREALESTRHRVETELRLDVVYGDTDSIMVDTGLRDDGTVAHYQKALEMGNQIKRLINVPGSHLELELDGVFSRLLLLKKKKYACVKVIDYAQRKFESECKGLDIVRRDWCGLTKRLGDQILALLFNPQFSVDAVVESLHDLLRKANDDLDAKRIALTEFIITKGLNKMPKQYADAKSQPHVQVAQRLLNKGRAIHPGTEIQFVICKSPTGSNAVAEKAFTLEEVTEQGLEIDIAWYKTTQLLPPIARLCQHVEGTDMQHLSQCFGLESSSYAAPANTPADTFSKPASVSEPLEAAQSDLLSRLRQLCHPTANMAMLQEQKLACPFCAAVNSVTDVLKKRQCPSCERPFPIVLLLNWLSRFTYQLSYKFGRFERECTECQAGPTTRTMLASGRRCPQASCPQPEELTLHPLLTARDICASLEHIRTLITDNCATDSRLIQACNQFLHRTAYHTFNLKPILSVLRPSPSP